MNSNTTLSAQLAHQICEYYQLRGQKWPNVEEAMMWLETECAEVYELLLARKDGWVRNNPANKPEFSKEALAAELGDAIMMLLVAGYVEDVDPMQALLEKVERKLREVPLPGGGRFSVSDFAVASGGVGFRWALRQGRPRQIWDVESPQMFCIHDVAFASECDQCERGREGMYEQKEERWQRG